MATHADKRTKLRSAIVLIVVAIAIAAGLATLESMTHDRVRRNELSWIQQRLDALVPPSAHDNDLLNDSIQVISPDLLGTENPVDIYRARLQGRPVAAILRTVAPYGYRG